MVSANPPSEHNTINLKLAEKIKNLTEQQQLILLKQLLKGKLTATLYQMIGKLTDKQQAALLDQLQGHPLKMINLEETEIVLRGHNRKSCMLSIDYTVGEGKFEGFMLDISPSGAFIETSEPFTSGQQIKLSFTLPNEARQLKISGEILWKGMLGIGVKFTDPDPETVALITAFMEAEEL